MTSLLQQYFTIERFESSDVDPTLFDHEAHVYVAWLYLHALPRDEAITRFDTALQRFTARIGASAKYDALVTWLFMMLIAERIVPGETWPAFRGRNADLIDGLPRSNAA